MWPTFEVILSTYLLPILFRLSFTSRSTWYILLVSTWPAVVKLHGFWPRHLLSEELLIRRRVIWHRMSAGLLWRFLICLPFPRIRLRCWWLGARELRARSQWIFLCGSERYNTFFHHESNTERQQFGGGRRTISYLYHGIWSGPVDSLASCSGELDSKIHRECYLFWAVSTRRVSDIQFHSLHVWKSYANHVTKTKLT